MTESRLELSIALSENENTRADPRRADRAGRHQAPSHALHPSEMFWRQLKFAEFDVSEMSMSSLTIATSQGPTQWVALPVFTTREFFHLRMLVRVASGIQAPADLKGKRVGVPEYQQTAAIWSRGVAAARVRRAPARHRVVHGAHAGDEPRRRDRLQAAGGRHRPSHPADHQHRRDDGARASSTRRCSISPHDNLVDRSRIDLAQRHPLQAAVRPRRREPSATSPRPASTRSTTAW